MSGRIYYITSVAAAVSAVQDLWELVAGTGKPLEILALNIGQGSDAGDAQAEQLSISIVKGFTTSGSGGGAANVGKRMTGDSAAGFTAEINNTTQANTGTPETIHADAFDVQAGYQYVWPLEARPYLAAGERAVCKIPAPADALTMSFTLTVRELG